MSLKERFNINYLFVNEEDIELLYSERYGETYRFKRPIEVPKYPGYYLIPNYLNYALNRGGVVINVLTGKQLKYAIDVSYSGKQTRGYHKIDLTYSRGQQIKTSRHRLLGMVFIPYSQHHKELQINHINGIPGDDRLDNLEWCTNSENARHAVDTGLRTKDITTVNVKNILTGEEFTTITTVKAALRTGLTVPMVLSRLRNQNYRPADGWVFKRKDETWQDLDAGVRARKSNTPVIVWDLINDSKTTYPSLIEAVDGTGNGKAGIRSQCLEKAMSPQSGKLFRYVKDQNTFPYFDDLQLEFFRLSGYPETIHTLGYAIYRNDELVLVATNEQARDFLKYKGSPSSFYAQIRRKGKYGEYRVDIISYRGT